MDDRERSQDELIQELEELRQTVAELRSREFERVKQEQELRREMRLLSDNARTAAKILQSTLTATNELQRELKQAKRDAAAASRAKSAFLVNMSHELRTPMTAILGFADLLLEEGDISRAPASRIENLQTLKRNGQSLMQVLSDILDLSKLESGDLEVERVAISPLELMQDIASVMRPAALKKGIAFDLAFEGKLPARIHTDPTRLRQVLMNLVGNAIRFTERGGVRVCVRLVQGDKRTRLRFDIADTGEGMSPRTLELAFDAFAQGDDSLTRKEGGLGLGLAIAKQLAGVLGGELEVDSLEGGGSIFRLCIDPGPLGEFELIDPNADDAQEADSLAEFGTRLLIEKLREEKLEGRILYIEDGEDNRRLVTVVLCKAGFEVTCAENGEGGIELAVAARDAGEPFDLILMDLQMPVLDGYEATRRLRAADFQVPIVALTAHALHGERRRALEAGCDSFLTKPIQRHELVEAIARYLRERKATAAECA